MDQLEGYSSTNETIRFKGKLYVGSNGELRLKIIHKLQQMGGRGHSGRQATIKRVEQFFYWQSLRSNVIKAVTECLVCQHNNSEHVPYLGLLQPLPIPSQSLGLMCQCILWRDYPNPIKKMF